MLALANEKLPQWVTLALVIAIAWQLSQVVWMLVPASSAGDPVIAPPMQAGISSQTSNQPNVRTIADAHLFGRANAEDVAPIVAQANVETLPDARVAFALKGTVSASDPNNSYAIIADSNKEEKVYKIGDPLQSGTTVHEIHLELVVLNQNGALSNLKLPKDFPVSAPSVRRSTPTVNRAARNNNTRSIQNVVTRNVSKLADVIRPTPYFVGGQQQGYRVYPGRDRKQFAALGLRPGDLIKNIDGAALNDPKQAMEIFKNLGNAEQVSVTIERNGSQQTLTLNTSQLALDKNK